MKLNSKNKAIILITISTLINAFGQLLWKKGVTTIVFSTMKTFILTSLNLNFILGWIFYALAALFMIISLRHGNLSLIHPFLSLTQVWVLILASMFLQETITINKISAVSLIIIGTILISRGDIE